MTVNLSVDQRLWLHINFPTNMGTLHYWKCPFCKDGRGVANGRDTRPGNFWDGPGTFQQIQPIMKRIRVEKYRLCDCDICSPYWTTSGISLP